MSEITWLDKVWRESLIMCPSQLEKSFKYKDKIYTCYLRWRWSDPWTFKLIDNSINNYNQQCIFVLNNLFFSENEYKDAEKKAEELVETKIDDLLKYLYTIIY